MHKSQNQLHIIQILFIFAIGKMINADLFVAKIIKN